MSPQVNEQEKINAILQDAAALSIDAHILLIGYLQLGLQNKYGMMMMKQTLPITDGKSSENQSSIFDDVDVEITAATNNSDSIKQAEEGPDLDLDSLHPMISTLKETMDLSFDPTDPNELTMRMEKLNQLVTSLYVSITQGEVSNNSVQQLYMLDILANCSILANNYYKATNNFNFLNAVSQCHDIAHICLTEETELDRSKERFTQFLGR